MEQSGRYLDRRTSTTETVFDVLLDVLSFLKCYFFVLFPFVKGVGRQELARRQPGTR